MATDMTLVVQALQAQNTLLGLVLQQMKTGAALPAYTVAGLPIAAPLGQLAYASDGRNPGEGVGSGTGCVVSGNGAIWRAVWSGAAVTV